MCWYDRCTSTLNLSVFHANKRVVGERDFAERDVHMDTLSLVTIGDELLSNGVVDAACEVYRAAVTQSPEDAVAHSRYANALYWAGHLEEAAAKYEEASQLDPENVDVHLDLGAVYYDMDLMDRTIEACNRVIELSPSRSEAWYNRGLALKKLKQFSEARYNLQRANMLTPNDHDIQLAIANLFAKSGNPRKAIRIYKRVLRDGRATTMDWSGYGQTLEEGGKYRAAANAYREALRLKPDRPNILFDLGRLLGLLGDSMGAVEAYTKRMELAPDGNTSFNLGLEYHKLEKYADAIEAFTQAIKLKPRDDDMHIVLGMTYDLVGRYEDAVVKYLDALELEPSSALAYKNLAVTLRHLRRYEDARIADRLSRRLRRQSDKPSRLHASRVKKQSKRA